MSSPPPPPYYTLYTDHFAQAGNRAAYYTSMRAHYGAIAPVEIVPGIHGWLVVSYQAAQDVLLDQTHFHKDPTSWASKLPPDHQVLGMLGPRPNPLFTDGAQHARYRRVVSDTFAGVAPHHLRDTVRVVADHLINRFARDGSCDLIAQFARPLPSYLFNRLFGQPDEKAPRLVSALAGLMEGVDEAAAATAEFEQYMGDLLADKAARPGPDMATAMMQHPAGLNELELLHHFVLTVAAGQEPTTNLLGNGLLEYLTDDALYTHVVNGTLDVRPVLDRVLGTRPPMANYGQHFVRQPRMFHNHWLLPDVPILISYEAAAQDPAVLGTGAHMAWSQGPHTCPASSMATTIAEIALTQLIHRLPDLHLGVPANEIRNRPGPYHHALEALPARFTPVTAATRSEPPWPSNPYTTATEPPDDQRHQATPASWRTWLPAACPAGHTGP
ncbi:cytochrome P450 [Streptomyces californicus]|uniref:cytochrome P450 n=1 Tax=Streptomyces californicus TaxID=67351 RepID=UPI00296EDF4F|nr:cytochrome P450 [Streptomyces californicus]MDW4916293.1 cytochrome P450 [Streptomyces californicus]